MAEAPWFDRVTEAKLTVPGPDSNNLGHLRFYDPNGRNAVIPVSYGDTESETARCHTNVWHIEVTGDLITVSPSIHFIGHFHSPNPVQFRLVESL